MDEILHHFEHMKSNCFWKWNHDSKASTVLQGFVHPQYQSGSKQVSLLSVCQAGLLWLPKSHKPPKRAKLTTGLTFGRLLHLFD